MNLFYLIGLNLGLAKILNQKGPRVNILIKKNLCGPNFNKL